jgi:hypothetical protein
MIKVKPKTKKIIAAGFGVVVVLIIGIVIGNIITNKPISNIISQKKVITATTDNNKNSKFIYSYNDKHKTATLLGYNGTSTDLKLPTYREYNKHTYKITTISDNAFNNKKLTRMTLPKYLKDIGNGAFYNNNLKTVVLPTTAKTIGESAFANNNISTVQWNTKLVEIQANAFTNNKLTDLNLRNDTALKSIGSAAFAVNQLASINLPKNLEVIDSKAFYNNNLTKKKTLVPKATKKQIVKSDVFSSNGDNQNSEISPTYY